MAHKEAKQGHHSAARAYHNTEMRYAAHQRAVESPKLDLPGAAPGRRVLFVILDWGLVGERERMYHRGDAALQAACGGCNSHRLHLFRLEHQAIGSKLQA